MSNENTAPTIWCCPECGSTDVRSPEWCRFNVARQEWVSAGGDTVDDEYWCENCQAHHKQLNERDATADELAAAGVVAERDAAVAELIAAAAEVRAAHRELPSPDHGREIRDAGEARIGRAHYALDAALAALAAVRGGKPHA